MNRAADVVVIGTGVAGLSTAVALAATRRVLLVSTGFGSTPWAQGGIAAAYGADDPLGHAHDTEVAGAGFCDSRIVRALVEEGPQRLAELIALGARFDRNADGSLSRTLEGGHDRSRVVHADGDASGAEVHRALRKALDLTDVQTVHGRAVGLIKSASGSVTGVLVEDDTGTDQIDARAVVLATGGIGNAYSASTNPSTVRGDGIALALRAGASLVDMEFVQFHPTALFTGDAAGQLPLVTEALRGEGAVLRDVHERRIMPGVHPRADLAPRDIVARAIESTMRRDGSDHVWLDARSIPEDTMRRRFPTVLASCRQIGVDLRREPIPVAPAAHFSCGGIRTNRDGATDVPGLYAVGEAAASGVNGANRLASNSLLEGLVFGRRVATALTLELPAASNGPESSLVMDEDQDPQAIRAILSKYAGIRRDGSGLRAAQDELESVGDGPLATVARAVVAAATTREDSRGCHWRSDHPRTDERWDTHIVVRLDADGRPAAYGSHPPCRTPPSRPTRQGSGGVLAEAVRRALAEDHAEDDITTQWAVPDGTLARARVVARQDGVISGAAIPAEVYRQLGSEVVVTEHVQDGDHVRTGQDLLTLAGPAREIITGERTALNFLQHMSGIATSAATYAEAVTGLPTRILDTRKTSPGLRALDKAAVVAGGVSNHRLDLAAMVLLKENHIAAAGGVSAAIAAVRAHNSRRVAIEVEVTSTAQAIEALDAGVKWIMLDNMPLDQMRHIVGLRGSKAARLEASGSITLDTVRAVAETGVDAISVGAITHSAPAFDLSLLLTQTAPVGSEPAVSAG